MADKELSFSELAKQCLEDSEEWFGDLDLVYSIPYYTLCLAGEVGEFANIVKKMERGKLKFDAKTKYEMAMELTDVFTYMLNIAALLQIDLTKSYQIKRAINEERFTEEKEARNESS
jgi:NTP pyrophosphatase (non-canonical NTP hydrolase)